MTRVWATAVYRFPILDYMTVTAWRNRFLIKGLFVRDSFTLTLPISLYEKHVFVPMLFFTFVPTQRVVLGTGMDAGKERNFAPR